MSGLGHAWLTGSSACHKAVTAFGLIQAAKHSSFQQGKNGWVGRTAQVLCSAGLGMDVRVDQLMDEPEVLKALCASYGKV